MKASTNKVISHKKQQDADEKNIWQFEIIQRFDLKEKKLKLKHDAEMRQLELKLENNVEMHQIALEERKVAL